VSSTALGGVDARAGVAQALRSEWVKFRTVRSTFWSLLLLAGVSVLVTTFLTSGSSTQGGSPGFRGDNDIVRDSLAGIFFGQIAAAVLAVLVVTSEYATRMIRTTFAATPRRRTVLVAKTAVVSAVVLAVGLATSAACFQVGQWILRGNGFNYEGGYPAVTLADGDALRAVVLSGAYLGLLAVFSVGVGAIVRHTAGAITIVLAVVLAPVIAVGFLPENVADQVARFSLMGAGLATQQTFDRPDNIQLSPGGGLLVVAAYGAVALLVALWLVGRRDA
jgi:ABC-2 type transport system permease protein